MTKQDRLIQAERLYRQGQLKQAESLYRDALAEDNENTDILHALAVIAARQQNMNDAIKLITRALELNPSDCRLLNSQGNIYSQLEDWPIAYAAFNKAIQLCPTYHTAYVGLGTCLMRQGKRHNAKRAFEKALMLNPHDSHAQYNLSLLLCHEEEWDEAKTLLKQVIERSPSFQTAWSQLATCYQQLNDWPSTVSALLDALKLNPNDNELMYRLGQAYTQLKQWDDATAAFETVLMQTPHHPTVYGELGIVLLQAGDPEKALTYFMRQLEIKPTAQCLYNIGVILMYQERHRDAIQYLERCTDLSPENTDAWLNLGALYLKRRDSERALKAYRTVYQIEPDNSEVNYIIQALEGKETPHRAPPEYITHLFDHYANFYDTHLEQHLKYNVPQQISQLLNNTCITHPENWVIIDLGCGTGLSGDAFKPYAQQLIGIDLSSDMISVAQSKNIYDDCIVDDIEVALSNFQDIDCIIAADVLSYFGNCLPIFKQVQHALKSSGYWLFSIEKGSVAPYALQKTMRYQHDAATLEQWLIDAGFKILARENAILRQQEKRPIEGYLYCCQKY